VTETTRTNTATTDREIVLERIFDAPRAMVFRAFTDPAHLPHWFGPKGFTITTRAIDVRPGGHWHFDMHGPDGTHYENYVHYLEIVDGERIVQETGDSPARAPKFHVTLTFSDEAGQTRLRQRMVFETAEACAAVKGFGAVELGYQTLDKLSERLKVMGLSITRTFDAPRELVFKACTEPERFAQWWGPKGFTLEIKRMEVKPGGELLYSLSNDGVTMWGKFVYVEIVAPAKLVFINSFSAPSGNVVRAPFSELFPLQIYNVWTLTEHDGKTTINLAGGPLEATAEEQAFFANMNAGMQQGFKGTFDQLDAYLAGCRAG
jgi:uncharacterized protein YndB with AHSA1/START domain